ncbi:MAG: TIGR00730 family Rossman fold protein [bacterium]|nr:TIGR00730 family Rossman fold protein [bacterium]
MSTQPIPAQQLPPLTKSDIHEKGITAHLEEIHKEFRDGFDFLKKYPKSVTIYGSARSTVESEHWAQAETLGRRIVKELGYTVITGGGPGMMAAAHKGAHEGGGSAVALGIKLPHEANTNDFATDRLQFQYFFARKTMLSFAAEAYIFMPGGFGTFDELFGVLTLIQTRKIPSVPIILIGTHFWNGLVDYMVKSMVSHNFIAEYDLNMFKVTDDIDEALEIIRTAPVSEWWRNIN